MNPTDRPQEIIHPVLIVEDDYVLAEWLAEVLNYANCTSDIAANGMEALERLRAHNYDAVVCDLMMPMVDGQALYEEVSRQYPYLAEKFLFITGQAASRSGLTDFVHRSGCPLLLKPLDLEELQRTVADVLAR